MIGLGIACSHAAGLWRPADQWPKFLDRNRSGVFEQYPTAVEQRDPKVAADQHRRVHAAFAKLAEQVADYQPDVILMIGDDQGDMFNSANNPTLAIYTGEERLWGRGTKEWDVPAEERSRVEFDNHVELSRHLLRGLVKRGFDVSNLARFDPVGKPKVGLSHMAARIVPELDRSGSIPIICLFINEYYPPLPSGARCVELGRAIADVFADRPERIAICASGGLSHSASPKNLNYGAIDIPLDRWILERLERNDVEALEHLFAFDADTMRYGTGEIRAWLSAAAAMNRPATVIDYMPIHATMTGCGFAYWPAQDA